MISRSPEPERDKARVSSGDEAIEGPATQSRSSARLFWAPDRPRKVLPARTDGRAIFSNGLVIALQAISIRVKQIHASRTWGARTELRRGSSSFRAKLDPG
ncbi:MAG: hypothetical protein V2B18_23900 [Pseudomonadota bacterium]